MSDEKMTAEQAWAEADRLDMESDVACLKADAANREASALIDKWIKAKRLARTIGPRPPVEPPNCLAELRHSGELGDRRPS